MSAHKNIDKICVVVVALTLVLALVFCNGKLFGVETSVKAIGYEDRIFDDSKVHTFDIVIDDWDSFLETCENEEYSSCNVVIDGEAVKNVGIRGKGNTSLSSVKNMDSNRYSFKIEFDQYDKGKTYHGLDKLCLNNIIQDNTYMKDYLAYKMMKENGVDTPLFSYVYITVNGEDWGLYLAVEAVEESFLERNYGSDYGELYKPDSLGFGGGGPGNGKDFNMTEFMNKNSDSSDTDDNEKESSTSENNENFSKDFDGNKPSDFTPPQSDSSSEEADSDSSKADSVKQNGFAKGGFGGGGFGGGMGSEDVKLKYIDDEIDSYSNIFGNAKTDVDKADKKRLISSLKSLSEQKDLESTVDVDEVIRYFVVHTFLCNGDSYTGSMVHNYYLYEEDGKLSMIPWDYNLAFGTFQGGNASGTVNSPIDTPVSGDMSDRPMISWIFSSDEYTELYHKYYSEFINSTDIEKLITNTAEMINEYVAKDPTKFCTYEEYLDGVDALKQFCELRVESVKGQLDGTIPSTTDGQNQDSSSLIDTGNLNISDMGSMGNKGGFGGNKFGNMPEKSNDSSNATPDSKTDDSSDSTLDSSSDTKGNSGVTAAMLEDTSDYIEFAANAENQNGEMPQPPGDFDGDMPQPPGDFDPENMPEDFDPNNMPQNPDQNNQSDSSASGDDSDSSNAQGNMTPPSDNQQQGENQNANQNTPQLDNMPNMMGDESATDLTSYILLGVSAVVLILGLGFAFKFRR